ncbi:MAG: hypothetical protein GX777_09260 [Fastidiosipila sp.]|nr:hypothetical protein [Fastidiosipila sp.]
MAYSIIMFAFSALIIIVGILIYRSNTSLVHDYQQDKVTDERRPAYSRAFAKGLFGIAATLTASGILGLFNEMVAAIIVIFLGLIISVLYLVRVQKQYNAEI